MKKLIAKAQNDTTTMWLVVLASFLIGIVVGIVLSPAKNGLSVGCNNTLTADNDDEEEELDGYGFDDDEDIKF